MFFIMPIIIIFAVITIFIVVKKKKTDIARVVIGVLIIIAGTASLCAVSFFGLLKILFMGGFLESRGTTPGEQVVIVTGFTLLMILSATVVIFGLSLFTDILKQKKMIIAVLAAGLIYPAFFGLTKGFDGLTQNVNLKGIFPYLTSKKFNYGHLRWNIDKSEAVNILREGYSSPSEETCRVSGKILSMKYNSKNKLYQVEVIFNTKTKKEQDNFVSCLTSKYGTPASKAKGVQCGCSLVKWNLPETEIKMTLYDEEINGASYTPPYDMVTIEYTFSPQYLKLKEAVAW
jgi:hypothetical protein